ncbi:MarR family winged helix-turn-helix transcriptional regulator [Kineococcus glutinatus]|uniref:HTH marR-type domain-containing protein n=1 Tax=Kineococcus glutinatus TaxID=1070872 RepID=A0ABP9HQ84_9ACTN
MHGRTLRDALHAAAVVEDRLSTALQPSGLSVDRWRVLSHAAHNAGSSMSDVVEALLLAPATATRAVDHLVDVGAVYRSADPADRRRVLLHASSAGVALLRSVEDAVGAVEDELAGVLDPGRAAALR